MPASRLLHRAFTSLAASPVKEGTHDNSIDEWRCARSVICAGGGIRNVSLHAKK